MPCRKFIASNCLSYSFFGREQFLRVAKPTNFLLCHKPDKKTQVFLRHSLSDLLEYYLND